jgi:hypothetical protein
MSTTPTRDDMLNEIKERHPEFYKTIMKNGVVVPTKEEARELLDMVKKDMCQTCESSRGTLHCDACKVTRYCCVECQRLDWDTHQFECRIHARLLALLSVKVPPKK